MSSASMPGGLGMAGSSEREAARTLTGMWWIWLILGVCWIVASLVILQFDQASVTTVGIITGILFTVAGLQQITLAAVGDSGWRWLWAAFGVLFLIAGLLCFIRPKNTFVGLADMLGFLFLMVGIWWTIRAFIVREVDNAWWLGLTAGILMMIMAFWTSGQFYIHKAYTLLVFAGIWALMHGITEVVRAFQMRSLHRAL